MRIPSWLGGAALTAVGVAAVCLLYAWSCFNRLPFDYAQATVASCLCDRPSPDSMPGSGVDAGQVIELDPPCHIEGREWILAKAFEFVASDSVRLSDRPGGSPCAVVEKGARGSPVGVQVRKGIRLWKVAFGSKTGWVDRNEARKLSKEAARGHIRTADVRCMRSARFVGDYLAPPAGRGSWHGVLKTLRSASLNSAKLVLPALALSVLLSYALAFASLEARGLAPLSFGVGVLILLCTVLSAFPVFVLGYVGNGLSGTRWLNAGFWRDYGAVLVIVVGNLVLADMTQHFRAELWRLRRQRYVIELAAMKGVRLLPHYWQPLLATIVSVVRPRVPLFIGLSLVVEMVCALDQGLGSVAYHSIVSEPKDFPCFFGAVVMFLLVVWAAQFAHWAVRDVWLYRHTGRYLVES